MLQADLEQVVVIRLVCHRDRDRRCVSSIELVASIQQGNDDLSMVRMQTAEFEDLGLVRLSVHARDDRDRDDRGHRLREVVVALLQLLHGRRESLVADFQQFAGIGWVSRIKREIVLENIVKRIVTQIQTHTHTYTNTYMYHVDRRTN